MIRALLSYFFGTRCNECLRAAKWGTFDHTKRKAPVSFWCDDHYHGTQTMNVVQTLERQM